MTAGGCALDQVPGGWRLRIPCSGYSKVMNAALAGLRQCWCVPRFHKLQPASRDLWTVFVPWGCDIDFAMPHALALEGFLDEATRGAWREAVEKIRDIRRGFESVSAPAAERMDLLVRDLSKIPSRRLFDYQAQGAYVLASRRTMLLQDEAGMGKTRQIGLAVASLREFPVVVVTRSGLKYAWRDELASVDETLKVQVLSGGEPASPGHDVYVLNYDIMDSARRAGVLSRPAGVMVFDESQDLLHSDSRRSVNALQYALAAHRVYLVSATPMPNRTADLYQQLRILRHPASANWKDFSARYCGAEEQTTREGKSFVDTKRSTNLAELRDLIAPLVICRRKSEVMELPPKRVFYQRLKLPLLSSYWNTWEDCRTKMRKQPLECTTRLFQAVALAKIPYSIMKAGEMLKNHRKVALFTGVIAAGDAFAKEFPDFLRVKGGMSGEKRHRIIKEFATNPMVRGIICASKAAGVGTNLQDATAAVVNDLLWRPDQMDQIGDRIHRLGTLLPCEVHFMSASGTIDDAVELALETKRSVVEAVTEWCGKVSRRQIADEWGRAVTVEKKNAPTDELFAL